MDKAGLKSVVVLIQNKEKEKRKRKEKKKRKKEMNVLLSATPPTRRDKTLKATAVQKEEEPWRVP